MLQLRLAPPLLEMTHEAARRLAGGRGCGRPQRDDAGDGAGSTLSRLRLARPRHPPFPRPRFRPLAEWPLVSRAAWRAARLVVGCRPHLVLLSPPDLSLPRSFHAAVCRASRSGLVFLPAGADLLPLCRDVSGAVAGRAGALGDDDHRCG